MKVKYINPGVEQMIDSIIGFQSEGESEFWSGALYHFYPQIDRDYAQSLPFPERKRYIESAMRAIYAEAEPEINRKAAMYNRGADCRCAVRRLRRGLHEQVQRDNGTSGAQPGVAEVFAGTGFRYFLSEQRKGRHRDEHTRNNPFRVVRRLA